MLYVIIWGNPVDGTEVIGPFDSVEEANDYAERWIQDDWWITLLQTPAREE